MLFHYLEVVVFNENVSKQKMSESIHGISNEFINYKNLMQFFWKIYQSNLYITNIWTPCSCWTINVRIILVLGTLISNQCSATTRISIIWWLIGLLSWHGCRTFQPRIFNPKLQPRNFNPRKQTTTWLKSNFMVQDFMVEKTGTEKSRVEAWGWIFLQLQKKNHGWKVPT